MNWFLTTSDSKNKTVWKYFYLIHGVELLRSLITELSKKNFNRSNKYSISAYNHTTKQKNNLHFLTYDRFSSKNSLLLTVFGFFTSLSFRNLYVPLAYQLKWIHSTVFHEELYIFSIFMVVWLRSIDIMLPTFWMYTKRNNSVHWKKFFVGSSFNVIHK